MTEIGSMKQRITLQQEAQMADGAGGYAVSWTDVATVWAEVDPVNGREVRFARRLEARLTHVISLRYRGDISPAMRVSYDGRLFNIRAIVNLDEGDRITKLYCEEGVAL